jgi:hypothetical protein
MELPRLLRSAIELEQSWRTKGYRFCIIGGIAVQRWGEPRNTRDLDLTLLTGFGGEKVFIDEILKTMRPRRTDASEFALLNRVLLVSDHLGTDIDISLGAMPFEERSVARATGWAIPGVGSITTCSATDLVVHKAFAARDQDWIDIRGVLIRSRTFVDWKTVLDELTPLVELKEEPEILNRLNSLYRSTAQVIG